jgi:GGDEF domain-containing protein
VTQPFDIEELRLRVANSITAAKKHAQIDDKSGLPTGRLIEDHLRQLMRGANEWTYIDLKISNYDDFAEVYGFVAGDDVIRFIALVMNETVDEFGTSEDFLGHPARDTFVLITHSDEAEKARDRIVERFNEEVKQHYSFIDRERGYILVPDGDIGERQAPLMRLAAGVVSTRTHQFSDIREITELAAENRRRGFSGEDTGSKILTEW